MTFDDVLGALMGLIGRRVEVALISPATGLVGQLAGTLAQGHDLTPRDDDTSAPVFFTIAEDAATGFIIDPGGFSAAAWSTDGAALRIEDAAGVVIVVEHAARAN